LDCFPRQKDTPDFRSLPAWSVADSATAGQPTPAVPPFGAKL